MFEAEQICNLEKKSGGIVCGWQLGDLVYRLMWSETVYIYTV